MTDCPNGEMRDLLPDLLHDRLSPTDRVRVQRHVDSCAACTAELELLRALRGTMRRAPAIDAARIAAAIPAYRPPVRRAWGGWRAAAAIVAVVVGGGSVLFLERGAPTVDVRVEAARAVPPESLMVADRATPGVPEQPDGSAPAPRPVPPAGSPAAESESLTLSSGALGELSDGDLIALLDELETLDAVPSEDVEGESALAPSIPLEGIR